MDRLRSILILRGLLAAFFIVLGVVLLVGGDAVFGVMAIAAGIVNAAVISVLVRRS